VYCVNPECPDFVETGQHPEFVHGVTVCPKCGEYLSESIPDDAAQPPKAEASPDVDFEPVFESWDPTELPIVKSLLDAAGIPYLVDGEERFDTFRGAKAAMRFNPRGASVFFLVPAHLAEDARALLEEVETEDPESRE
jgi:hypothetical protein